MLLMIKLNRYIYIYNNQYKRIRKYKEVVQILIVHIQVCIALTCESFRE